VCLWACGRGKWACNQSLLLSTTCERGPGTCPAAAPTPLPLGPMVARAWPPPRPTPPVALCAPQSVASDALGLLQGLQVAHEQALASTRERELGVAVAAAFEQALGSAVGRGEAQQGEWLPAVEGGVR
jgi:hypothetical protein